MKSPFRLRKPWFFPLNYGEGAIPDFRSLIADFKCRTRINSCSTVGEGRSDVAIGRAEAGLISTAESVVESLLNGERV